MEIINSVFNYYITITNQNVIILDINCYYIINVMDSTFINMVTYLHINHYNYFVIIEYSFVKINFINSFINWSFNLDFDTLIDYNN